MFRFVGSKGGPGSAMRRWFAVPLLGAILLVGCGDNEAGPPVTGPEIQSFVSDRAQYLVGEQAFLTATFSGDSGRIEPGLGPVRSGIAISTGPLDVSRTFRLIVTADGRSVERELELPVSYRDRYRALPQQFRAVNHSATLLADGRVAVIGGSRGQAAISSDIDLFDPASESFTRVASMATGRENHTATLLHDDRLLVVGGNAGLAVVVPAELFDPRTGAVVATGTSVAERQGHTATRLASGDVLIVGGNSNEGLPFGISDSAEIWDAETGQFRLLDARLARPREGHTASLLADGRVLIVGGYTTQSPYVLAEVFDPDTEAFAAVPGTEDRTRALHAAVEQTDGSVLILGGEDGVESVASVLRFDAANDSFSTRPNLMRPRSVVRAVGLRDDRVLLFGGESLSSAQRLASAESYRVSSGALDIEAMPIERAWHTAVRLEDGRVLVVGGEAQGGSLVREVIVYE